MTKPLVIQKKVCLLGDFAVGKTSLVRRFVHDLFDDKYITTIGVKVSRKAVTIPRDSGTVEMTMMLWDLAGSEEFDQMRASYLRGTAGAVLVCDLTRAETLDRLWAYAHDLSGVSPGVRLILAANKRDLVDQQNINTDGIEALAAHLNAPHYLTSAKTGCEVEALFGHLGRLLLT